MMEIHRLLPGDDTATVARLSAEVQALHAAAEPHRYKKPGRKFITETARWFASLLPDIDRFVLLGTVAGEPVAYASAALIYYAGDVYRPESSTLYIDQFGVTAKQRGHGYGRALLDVLVEIGRYNDAQAITLDVQAFNSDAIGFYQHYGFRERRYRMALPLEERGA